MAATCPVGFDVAGLRAKVLATYDRVARAPGGHFRFHRGPRDAPDKSQVFAEIYRVLRPGGRLYLADVVVQRELKYEVRNSPDLWAACIAGALPEAELTELALASRFHEPRITERFDCFRDTTAE